MSGYVRRARPTLGPSDPIRTVRYHFLGGHGHPAAAAPSPADGRSEWLAGGGAACANVGDVRGALQDVVGRLIEHHMQIGSAFVELTGVVTCGVLPGMAGVLLGLPSAVAPHARPAEAMATTGMDCEVVSKRHTEVRLDFHPRPGRRSVARVHALHASDGKSLPITDVHVFTHGAATGPVLRIVVPDDRPPGSYTGVIVDAATNEPLGTILLKVH